jgi:hypothetical protein
MHVKQSLKVLYLCIGIATLTEELLILRKILNEASCSTAAIIGTSVSSTLQLGRSGGR